MGDKGFDRMMRWLAVAFGALGALGILIGVAIYVSRAGDAAQHDAAVAASIARNTEKIDARLDKVEQHAAYELGRREGEEACRRERAWWELPVEQAQQSKRRK